MIRDLHSLEILRIQDDVLQIISGTFKPLRLRHIEPSGAWPTTPGWGWFNSAPVNRTTYVCTISNSALKFSRTPTTAPLLPPLLSAISASLDPSRTTSWDKVSSLSSMEGPLDEDGKPEWSAISNSSLCTVPECINRPSIHVVICGELSLFANAYYSIPSEIRKQHQFQKQYLDHSSFCYLAKHLGARLRWFFFNICCFILIVINFG